MDTKYYYRVVVVSPSKNVYTWLLITSVHCDGYLAAKKPIELIIKPFTANKVSFKYCFDFKEEVYTIRRNRRRKGFRRT